MAICHIPEPCMSADALWGQCVCCASWRFTITRKLEIVSNSVRTAPAQPPVGFWLLLGALMS